MTLIATIARNDFVLSVADRRSCFQSGNSFMVKDEHFNKHVFFALPDIKGMVSYCGYAEWINKSGQTITTDKIIGNVFAQCSTQGKKFGEALAELARSLDVESDWLSTHHKRSPPFFTLHLAGFTNVFREPWVALISDTEPAPQWNEDKTQYNLPSQGRFRIYFAIRCRPCALWSGQAQHLPSDTHTIIDHLLSVKKLRPFDIANFVISRIRLVSKRTSSVGSRASAIVAPAEGMLDTGIWTHPNEDTLAMMPRMVFLNGTQWDSSEIKLDLSSFITGRMHHHGLMYRSLLPGRIPRRFRRRLEHLKSQHKTPTISEMMNFVFFGHHWDDN